MDGCSEAPGGNSVVMINGNSELSMQRSCIRFVYQRQSGTELRTMQTRTNAIECSILKKKQTFFWKFPFRFLPNDFVVELKFQNVFPTAVENKSMK